MSYNIPPPVQHDGAAIMERLAKNASMQAISRLSMIFLATISIPFWTASGWVAARLITTMDKLIDQQNAMRDNYIALENKYNGKVQLLDLTDLHLDSKMTEIDGRLNKRIDTISNWTQRTSEELDNLKEKLYPLLPRERGPH